MTAEVNALILLAQCNESKGFYRPGNACSTAKFIDAFRCDERSVPLSVGENKRVSSSTANQYAREVVTRDNSRKQDVERDKLRIQQLLSQGHSIKEVQHITGRSIAFIYKYNPRNKTIH